MTSDQTETVHRFDRGRPGDWHPVQPATASLSIDIEAHDAEVVQERLAVFMTELRAEYGTAVGAMVVEVSLSSDQPEPDSDEREALEAACLEGLVETPHGYRYRPALGADAVLRLGYSRTPDAHLAAAKAEALDEAAEAFATGEWVDAYLAGNVEDDESAARATEAWLRARAARLREQADPDAALRAALDGEATP